MADSLGQAWRDLNDLLEYRRQLLEKAVAFQKNVTECNQKITEAQKTMESDMESYQDKGSARDWLQEHHNVRKGEWICINQLNQSNGHQQGSLK